MPQIGERQVIEYRISRSALETEYSVVTSPITEVMVEAVIWGVAGGLAFKASKAFAAALISSGAVLETGIASYLLDTRAAEIEGYLNTIKADDANGVVIKQEFIYMYMSGSGTGWYESANPVVSTY
ncbi:MAG: hypothetical protein ACOYVK_21960 [Bacillota bacterium]